MKQSVTQAVLILHEIYGINPFIQNVCQKFQDAGFAVFCPNLIGRTAFTYAESQAAYDHFVNEIGFGCCAEVRTLLHRLKERYEKVIVIGFSIGATLA